MPKPGPIPAVHIEMPNASIYDPLLTRRPADMEVTA